MNKRRRSFTFVLALITVVMGTHSLATAQQFPARYSMSWLTDNGDERLGLYGLDTEGNTVPGQLAVIVRIAPGNPPVPGQQLENYGSATPIFIPCGQDPSTHLAGLRVITFLRSVRASLEHITNEDGDFPSFQTDIPPLDNFAFAPDGPLPDLDFQALRERITSVEPSEASSLIGYIESLEPDLRRAEETYLGEIEENHKIDNRFQARFRNCDGELGVWADVIQHSGFRVGREAERTWLEQAIGQQGTAWTAQDTSWNPNYQPMDYGIEPFRNIWTQEDNIYIAKPLP